MSSRMGSVINSSERTVSLKTTWYTPASDAANMNKREVVRRPLVPGVLVGVILVGIPSFSHSTDGV